MSDTRCAQQGQFILVVHDLKRPRTPNGSSRLAHFTAWVPAWDAHVRFCRWGRDRNGFECVRPPQYRWPTAEGKERYAPVVTFGSVRIERTLFEAASPAGQKPAKQSTAP